MDHKKAAHTAIDRGEVGEGGESTTGQEWRGGGGGEGPLARKALFLLRSCS